MGGRRTEEEEGGGTWICLGEGRAGASCQRITKRDPRDHQHPPLQARNTGPPPVFSRGRGSLFIAFSRVSISHPRVPLLADRQTIITSTPFPRTMLQLDMKQSLKVADVRCFGHSTGCNMGQRMP